MLTFTKKHSGTSMPVNDHYLSDICTSLSFSVIQSLVILWIVLDNLALVYLFCKVTLKGQIPLLYHLKQVTTNSIFFISQFTYWHMQGLVKMLAKNLKILQLLSACSRIVTPALPCVASFYCREFLWPWWQVLELSIFVIPVHQASTVSVSSFLLFF